ncbi:MAG: tetratricopeptide repeat protein [Candidatus Gastranaerophilales bacterium]|nr:tetratricopeptide repeat protein [Candidatus Gastranaerophilales bacterium]
MEESVIDYIKQSFELKNQKLYKEAIEVLYKVLSDDTDTKTTVEVISQIGDLHILLKNYERAIEEYMHVLELDPDHAHSKNKLYDIYFSMKDYNKALKIAEDICTGTEKSLDWVKYFSVLLKLGKTEEILKKYEELNAELKNDPYILYMISLIREENKKEVLTKVIKGAPTFAEAKFDLAMIYYNENNFECAEKYFNEILAFKQDSLSYYYKALILLSKKDFFPAINNLHLAIKSSKGAVQEFYFELAKAYMEINWFEEAITTIKKSISLCIEHGENKLAIDKRYLLLAWVFEKQKDYDNALFNLGLISENSQINVQAKILEALIFFKKGDIVKAKTGFEDLYAKNPSVRGDLTLLDSLGAIYKELKLNAKACEFFNKHLQQYPDSIHTACEYTDLLIDMEKYDEAKEIIKKYSVYGKNASFLNSMARIHYRLGENKQALECLDELIKNDPNNAEGYYFKGLILNKEEEFKDALSCIGTALELNPVPAKYYAQGAHANFGLGFYNDAMLYIKEAIEIEPNDLNYKKFAAEIAEKSGKNLEAGFWHSIVDRSEKLIKDSKRF